MAAPNPPDSSISDLIKIGIPSLVTLATGLYAYLLGRAGHKKDIAIEQLRSDSANARIASEKKSALVMEVAAKISAVENAMGRHSGVFRSENIKDESTVTVDALEKAREAFREVGNAIDACIGARVQIDLLGDSKLSARYTIFMESLFTYQAQARPDKNMNGFDLTGWFNRVGNQKAEVLRMLGEIHLGTSPATE